MRASLAKVLPVLSVLALPAVARAQIDDQPLPGDATADIEGESDRTYAGRWWGDLAFYTGDETPESDVEIPDTSVTLIAPTFGGMYRLSNVPLAFEARLGMVLAFVAAEGADTESSARFANPMLAASYADRFGRVDVRAGLGLALPLASMRDSGPGSAVDYLAYTLIAGANGLWDWYLWVPDCFTLLIPVAVEARIGENFVVGGELGLHFLFSTADETTEDGVSFATDDAQNLQIAAEFAYRTRSTRTGVQLRWVEILSAEGDGDSNQFSLEPYLRFEMAPAFFRVALSLNLDEPFGFSFESGPSKVWALHLGGGTQF